MLEALGQGQSCIRSCRRCWILEGELKGKFEPCPISSPLPCNTQPEKCIAQSSIPSWEHSPQDCTGLQSPLILCLPGAPQVLGKGIGAPGHPLPDDDTLVLPIDQHVSVHVVRQGIDVGGIFILSLKQGCKDGDAGISLALPTCAEGSSTVPGACFSTLHLWKSIEQNQAPRYGFKSLWCVL